MLALRASKLSSFKQCFALAIPAQSLALLAGGGEMSRLCLCEEDRNTETQRTQSFASRLSSVVSVASVFQKGKLHSRIRVLTASSPATAVF